MDFYFPKINLIYTLTLHKNIIMKNILIPFLFLISFQIYSAQDKSLNENEIQKQYDYLDQQETNDKNFKTVQKLYAASQKIHYEQGMVRGANSLTGYYITKSDYQKATSFNEEAKKLAEKLQDAEALFIVHNNKSRIYAAHGFETESFKENRLSLTFAQRIKDPDIRHYTIALFYQNMGAKYATFKKLQDSVLIYLKKSLEETGKMSDGKKWFKKKYDMLIYLNSNLGNFYTGVQTPPRLDLAEPYYLKSLGYQKTHPEIFKNSDMDVLNSAGRFYVEKGNYRKAIELAQEVLKLEKNKKNPRERMIAYANLANSYEELKDVALQAQYTNLYSYLSDSLNLAVQKSLDKSSKQIVSAEKNAYSKITRNIIWSVIGLLLLTAIAAYIFWRKNNKKSS